MESLRPGVRVLKRVLKATPAARISQLDAAGLARFQARKIPDRGTAALMAGLLLGRPRRGVSITRQVLMAPESGQLPLRIYTPTTSAPAGGRPVVISYHGGGFVVGEARQADWINSNVAQGVDAVVVAVDYRLAPGHPFPAAVEDCYTTLLWVHQHAVGLGADPNRIGVMGESAGGNLAAVVSIMARDQAGPRIGHQALIYPATDLTEGSDIDLSDPRTTRNIVLSEADMKFFGRQYLTLGTDPGDWRVSPLRAPTLAGLPPVVVVVAGLDPLHDSGVAYAEALRSAGVPTTLEDYAEMPHGFLNFPYFSKAARPAIRAIVASQRAALQPWPGRE